MKRVPYLAKEQLRQSAAWQILQDPSLKQDGTRKAMRLIHFIDQNLKNSPSAVKNHLRHEGFSDLKTELTENVELHAALDCFRLALKPADPNSDRTVFPAREILSLDGTRHLSPFQYAENLENNCPQIGKLLTRYLTTHEKTLEYRQEQQKIAPARPDYTDYSKLYTAQQNELWN